MSKQYYAEDLFLAHLDEVANDDVVGLKKVYESYGPSWKQRGGVGAFMMLARKWDRMEKRVRDHMWDIFQSIEQDPRAEGVIDDVRDLRRYLMLVESEMRARGTESALATHRDNQQTVTTHPNISVEPTLRPCMRDGCVTDLTDSEFTYCSKDCFDADHAQWYPRT